MWKLPFKIYLLVFLLSMLAAGNAVAQTAGEKAAFQKVVASTRGMKSMTADFTETKNLKMLTEAVTSSGKLWYKSPSYMRWEYDSRNYGVFNPKGGYMVRNGQRDGAQSRGFSNMGRMVTGLLNSISEDIKDYKVSYKIVGKKLEVTAEPVSARMKTAVKTIVMNFDVSTSLISSFEIINDAGTTLIVFTSVRTDIQPDSQLFN